jgi:hypothetical protein
MPLRDCWLLAPLSDHSPIEIVPGLSYSSRAELYCLAALLGGAAGTSKMAEETT